MQKKHRKSREMIHIYFFSYCDAPDKNDNIIAMMTNWIIINDDEAKWNICFFSAAYWQQITFNIEIKLSMGTS